MGRASGRLNANSETAESGTHTQRSHVTRHSSSTTTAHSGRARMHSYSAPRSPTGLQDCVSRPQLRSSHRAAPQHRAPAGLESVASGRTRRARPTKARAEHAASPVHALAVALPAAGPICCGASSLLRTLRPSRTQLRRSRAQAWTAACAAAARAACVAAARAGPRARPACRPP